MTLRKFLSRFTRDRGTRDPPGLQEILTVEQIGPRRSKTPEGFLLCEAVPIARIGIMAYGPGEVPIEPGRDGIAWVSRDAAELFRAETLASFVGKPVVDEHPDDEVTPDNWAKLAKGVAFNIRQGTGEDADVILADLLITDARMIRDIDAMKREVSAGYEADYEQLSEGQGVQTNIIGNHIALVEKGRCGPRCAIGDHHPSTAARKTMATAKHTPAGKHLARRRISKATLDALAEMIEEEEEDASTHDETGGPSDSHTHIHIHGIGSTAPGGQGAGPVDVSKDEAGGAAAGSGAPDATEARFVSLENGHKEILGQIAQLADAVSKLSGQGGSGGNDPSGKTGDENNPDDEMTDDENPFAKKDGEEKDKEKGKTNDSAALEGSYKEVLSGCEILVPGFRVPTFDSKATRKSTLDAMCSARRRALDAFGSTDVGLATLTAVSGAPDLDLGKMQCQDVAILFRAAVGARKLANNGAATRDASSLGQPTAGGKKVSPKSQADLNKMFREHYGKQH